MPSASAAHFSKFNERKYQYLDYKLPIHSGLVDRIKSKHGIKKLCLRMLLITYAALQRSKPSNNDFVRVVAFITLPEMFGSRITIFFDKEYFQRFCDRKGPFQLWTLLSFDRNLLRDWQLDKEFQIEGVDCRR